MRKTRARTPVMLALASLIASLMTFITPADAQANPNPQFSLSTTAGPAGSRFAVNEIDPCPAIPSDYEGQYIELIFRDAEGAETKRRLISTRADGTWGTWGVGFTIPSRGYSALNPPTIVEGAALGQAVVSLRCWRVQATGDPMEGTYSEVLELAQEYSPTFYTVDAPSREFVASASVKSGDLVHIQSSDVCPGNRVQGSVWNSQRHLNFTIYPSPNQPWSVEVSTLEPNDMGEPTTDGVTPGNWGVSVTCMSDASAQTVFSYGGELVEILPSLNYVAMGDSYSAGEGIEPFEVGTESGCHRSSQAYPRVLSAELDTPLLLNEGSFAACSGAVSDDIKDGTDAQMNKVTADTDVVTMTIGGNDMPFEDFATACVMPGTTVSCDEGPDDAAIAGIAHTVIPEVREALQALDSHISTVGSNATVLVLGYPQIIPETWVSETNGCWWLQPQETPAIRYVVQQLNTAIKNEVDALGGNFHFVSATDSNSPFIGHELCRITDDDEEVPRYFLNVNVNAPAVYTFHPNAAGHRAYATLVKNWLAQHPLS